MPDLFSPPRPDQVSDASPQATSRPALKQPVIEPKYLEPKYVLPKDFAVALKRLADHEIDALLSAVTTEAQRRGRVPKRQSRHEITPVAKQTDIEEIASGLPKGKLNAVRAAFKAGVKPSAIARQFGLSRSEVRKALAAERRR
jgi:hypothetical protein